MFPLLGICKCFVALSAISLPCNTYFDDCVQQRAATAGGRWFNPEEFTQQKVHITPFTLSPRRYAMLVFNPYRF
jgi:hypothetical protein